MVRNIGIGWQLHDRTGWGVYGINLALHLASHPDYNPVLLFPSGQLPEHPLQKDKLHPLTEYFNNLAGALKNVPNFTPDFINLTILHGLGNNFAHIKPPINSPDNAGIIFFENTRFNRQGIAQANQFPLIITGSHWNESILKNLGLKARIETVIQGIDPTVFHPAPKSGLFKDRFVVFSGGKLEYRKGQDIVIAAFRIFQKRHPEALLLTAWHNSWPESMAEIATRGHVTGFPKTSGNQQQAITKWLLQNGLPKESFLTLPPAANIYMAPIIREADVALFPNRGEGGTNLVAMETLASGIPVIMAANSGQLDFADPSICIPLKKQMPVKVTAAMSGVEGWGESDVEEVVAALEEVYSDPENSQQRALRAVDKMLEFSWDKQIQKLLQVIEKFLQPANRDTRSSE